VIHPPITAKLTVSKDDSSAVSVFVFDGNSPQSKERLPLAKNALKKLKTIRHPSILTYIDCFDTESAVYIVTQRVTPLTVVMEEEQLADKEQREQWLIWGLERITVCILPSPSDRMLIESSTLR
jgi:SCY1-like protein 1